MGSHVQYGILALSSVDDYENGKIKRHELTLPKKELDRTNLCDVQGASAEPIFLAFRGGESIEKMMDEVVHTT